ncbi:MAG: hypothetical protein H6644_01505 [Caldilineaceae bacterium]|nr:hypothetical protein [Caldilineaceae bacterium]
MPLFDDIIRRTRQHHAIEHATIHLLSARLPGQRFSGLSDPAGFTIYGDVDEVVLRRAVGDALLRLQAGEARLAIHPNCGTNLAVTALLTTASAFVAAGASRRVVDRIPLTFMLALPALVLSRPLGLRVQQYTTLADVGDRWVADVFPVGGGAFHAHRVVFD